MIKMLLDQGLPRTAASLLRERGWDVQHVSERGMSRAEDVASLRQPASPLKRYSCLRSSKN